LAPSSFAFARRPAVVNLNDPQHQAGFLRWFTEVAEHTFVARLPIKRLMGACLFGLGLFVYVASVRAQATPLITPAELAQRIDDPALRIVDIRSQQAYLTAHLPGAVNAPYPVWRGPAGNPGELPSLARMTTLLQKLGVSPELHIIVVSHGDDASDFGSAARVYWTLKVHGLRRVSILNGGHRAWVRAEHPTDPGNESIRPSSFVPVVDNRYLASKDEVLQRIRNGRSQLVDARPAAFYRGETRHGSALAAGTLRGASNLEHDRWFVPGTGQFLPVDKARSIASAEQLSAQTETVSFCNTGHWAATNWFALSEVLGHSDVKLYPGSMVEWTQDREALPMDHVPNRLKALLIDTKLWMERR
jgi:thiosulfate/3-mercaptopyruvate sulfurtransferase